METSICAGTRANQTTGTPGPVDIHRMEADPDVETSICAGAPGPIDIHQMEANPDVPEMSILSMCWDSRGATRLRIFRREYVLELKSRPGPVGDTVSSPATQKDYFRYVRSTQACPNGGRKSGP